MASIRQTIIDLAKARKGKSFYTFEIRWDVRKFYQSRTGFGQQFMTERISEACYRLVNDGIIERVKIGEYKLVRRKRNDKKSAKK